MTRTQISLVLAGLLGALVSGSASALTADATAEIVNPIAITQTDALAFGSITTDKDGGTATIAASVGAALVKTTGGSGFTIGTGSKPGKFTVTGGVNNTYAITLAESVTLTGTKGDTLTSTLVTPKTSGLTLTDGSSVFYVGGVLTIGANKTNDTYTGTYTVTVAYE